MEIFKKIIILKQNQSLHVKASCPCIGFYILFCTFFGLNFFAKNLTKSKVIMNLSLLYFFINKTKLFLIYFLLIASHVNFDTKIKRRDYGL